jgi:8-oxo-dGTP pyrophosphatase MutT (NUDIX family)
VLHDLAVAVFTPHHSMTNVELPMLTRETIVERLRRPQPPHHPDDAHLVTRSADASVTLAAVLVPLVHRNGDINVLFTQRTPHLNDHANQISFPGGRVEESDRDRIETALREAEEEVGLVRERIEILGRLPDHELASRFRVSPVVGWIEAPFATKVDPFEVTEVFEVPLAHFLDPANHQRRNYRFFGRERHYMAMPYRGRYIWGATAAMLYSLYRQLQT